MRETYYYVLLGLLFLVSCNLDQEIEIELPEYESYYVVECYLEPERNYRLLLTRSTPYFEPFSTPQEYFNDLLVTDAQVYIIHRDRTIQLFDQPQFDLSSRKVFNYTSTRRVPRNYSDDFQLKIITPEGDSIHATTRILPPVPIDSVITEFNDTDSLARVLTYFTDIPDTSNYFRRMLHEGSLDSLPVQDFPVDDRFVEDVFVFGTGYDYGVGDTVITTVFHIDEAYFNFLETFIRASNSNGNPFGQPSPIATNLYGTANAIGIFTGLSLDRRRMILKK